MILSNLRICGQEGMRDIQIEKDKFVAVRNSSAHTQRLSGLSGLTFDGAIAFPGLINSHDHLDFNLFERMGGRLYPNYVEWANHLQQSFGNKIAEITGIPLQLRVAWGMYKNLLNGFTTVVNHGRLLDIPDPVIDILQPLNSLHSIRLEKNWQWKINRPSFKKKSFAIHVGEGTDEQSTLEIDRLLRGNIFKRELIGIHGVAMTEEQAEQFKALVWCPASNHFLLGQTAPIDQIAKHTDVIFGTDSTLTADWNAWTQIREARATGMATDEGLFDMMTKTPARVWHLQGNGALEPDKNASLVIARNKTNDSSWDAFYSINPEDILLIIHRGSIRLFDEELKDQIEVLGQILPQFGLIGLGNSRKFVPKFLPGLAEQLKKFNTSPLLPFFV